MRFLRVAMVALALSACEPRPALCEGHEDCGACERCVNGACDAEAAGACAGGGGDHAVSEDGGGDPIVSGDTRNGDDATNPGDPGGAVCGNDEQEPGELCDHDCPTECPAAPVCYHTALLGGAATCDARCVTDPLAVCAPGDFCCPPGCEVATDGDCPADCTPPQHRCVFGCCAWQIQTVDELWEAGYASSLAIDSANRPHIVYANASTEELMYARPGATCRMPLVCWGLEAIDDTDLLSEFSNVLLLDPEERPWVAYRRQFETDSQVWLARGQGGSFTRSGLEGESARQIAMTLDLLGRLVIAYYDFGLSAVRVGRDIGGWQFETVVDTALDYGQYPALASWGATVHLIYEAGIGFDRELRHGQSLGAGWSLGTVETIGWGRAQGVLGADGQGRLHAAYHADFGAGDSEFRYALYDGGSWAPESIEIVSSGGFISLTVDDAGVPHVAYVVNDDESLRYGRRDQGGWQLETVVAGHVGEAGTAIALDGWGQPHITFFDDRGSLRLASY